MLLSCSPAMKARFARSGRSSDIGRACPQEPGSLRDAVLTIARIRARIASGRSGLAATKAANSGHGRAFLSCSPRFTSPWNPPWKPRL